MKVAVLASLILLAASSASESREKPQQVDHPPLLEEQHPDVDVDTKPHPTRAALVSRLYPCRIEVTREHNSLFSVRLGYIVLPRLSRVPICYYCVRAWR